MTREEMEKEAEVSAVGTSYYGSDYCMAYVDGYLSAAEPRERELEGLRAEVAKVAEQRDAWPKYHGMATEGLMVLHDRTDLQDLSGLRCGDFMANAVPHLVAEIDRLRARVAELEEIVEGYELGHRGFP